jgi:hypothetical protein
MTLERKIVTARRTEPRIIRLDTKNMNTREKTNTKEEKKKKGRQKMVKVKQISKLDHLSINLHASSRDG